MQNEGGMPQDRFDELATEGVMAYLDGASFRDCPYSGDEADAWMAGYEDPS